MKPPRPKYLIKDSLTEQQENYAVLHVNWNWGLPYSYFAKKGICLKLHLYKLHRDFHCYIHVSQKAWSGLSPMRNPVHLRLWGLSFPSVESQFNRTFVFVSVLIHGLLIPSQYQLWSSQHCLCLQFESGTLVGPRSDPKSEFSGTKSPDPDPRESQKCLLGCYDKSANLGTTW